jgi:hypothetical protein
VVAGTGKEGCSEYSVQVDGKIYTCDEAVNGHISGFNIVAFNRQPATDANAQKMLQEYKCATFHTDTRDLQPVRQYLQDLVDDPKELLVIVSTLGQVNGATSDIADQLEHLGATTEFRGIGYPEFAFSFIGINRLKSGQSYQVGGDGVFKNTKDTWSLDGYFATDSAGLYAFFQPDYVQFELSPGTGTIKIGSQEYKASGVSGMHIVEVPRANPETANKEQVKD